jgi:hypothetical protein
METKSWMAHIMPYYVEWDNVEKTAVLCSLQGHWTWHEMSSAIAEMFTLLDEIDHQAALIFHTSNHSYIPLGALANLRRLINISHPNEGIKMLVGVPALIAALFAALNKSYDELIKEFWFVDTLDEARTVIQQQIPHY